MKYLTTLTTLIALIAIWELIIACNRKVRRRLIYAKAEKKAKQTNKYLIVIGDPDNGAFSKLTGRDYGEGDITIDITGCPGCKNGVKLRAEDALPVLPDNSCVIFVSCVLEYVNDIKSVAHHINRVSGGDYYIVNVEPYCLTAYYYFGKYFTGEEDTKRVIYNTKPIKWFDLPRLMPTL